MVGDTSDAVWGVMDIFPLTNFPDIRKKTSMRSAAGNLLIIPREGGSMVRFYIELPRGTVARTVTLEDIQTAARNIFSQYSLDFADTFWWSAYSIGQRLADHFAKDNRIFLTGDACHTHSPKAGQGMNLSLQDGYNIGWKLAMVLRGQAGPELLKTYNLEREKTAADLIAFDREITGMLSSSSKQSIDTVEAAKAFSDHFIKSAKYMAGLTTTYADSMITTSEKSTQSLAKNIAVGMRFPSAQVVRFCDARAMQLSKALKADGRWRIMVFAGDLTNERNLARVERLAESLSSPAFSAFTPIGAALDSVIECILILHGDRTKVEDEGIEIPSAFTPVNGKWHMRGK
jgi:phenol 2-monooxygenase (NADPH)